MTTADKRNYKKWTLEWMKDKRSSWTDEDIDFAKRSSLKEFRSYGHYCRMLSRGFPHINQLTDVVESYITKLISLGKTKKESLAGQGCDFSTRENEKSSHRTCRGYNEYV